MQRLKVEQRYDGKKLITYLTSVYPELNINTLRKTLRLKDIKINGNRVKSDVTIYYGDEIEVYIKDELILGKTVREISIVFEDESIILFDKPTNIEVTELKDKFKNKYEYLEPCHRIDRNTVGLVLFAKNEECLKYILSLFKDGKIEKHYIACCYGVAKNEDTLEAYLFKDRKKSLVYISNIQKKGYSKIVTSYKLIDLDKKNKISIIDVNLHTGRTHQIRAHLAHVGLPIIGDGKYGPYEVNHRFKKKTQALCSYSLTFHEIEDERFKYLNNKTIKLNRKPFNEIIYDIRK